MNRAERSCRAQVFARAATDATFRVNHRNLKRLRVIRIQGSHLYRGGGAFARAEVARRLVNIDYA